MDSFYLFTFIVMKKLILAAVGVSILMMGSSTTMAYSEPTVSIQEYLSKQTQMRMEYYNTYKAKGYDVSLLTADILNPQKTEESQFWEVFKQVKNNYEIPQRREYVAKLKSYGYNVSAFTETIIVDGTGFWDIVKYIESKKKPEVVTPVKPVEVTVAPEKKGEEKKGEEKKVESTRKISQTQEKRLVTLMKNRIAKIQESSRSATLTRLEQALINAIESARTRKNTLLIARYEILLAVVQEEIGNTDDELLVESLFNN